MFARCKHDYIVNIEPYKHIMAE